MDYWRECICEAFDDAGIVATDEQIQQVVDAVEGAHENYGMATGIEAATKGSLTDAEQELQVLKEKNRKHAEWVASTDPCKDCHTSGTVLDGWGRIQTCGYCDGTGRVRR